MSSPKELFPDRAKEEPNSGSSRKMKVKVIESDSSAVIFENTSDEELEKVNEGLGNIAISENQDGNWLSDHPWQGNKPDRNLKMEATVAISSSYPISTDWTIKESQKLYVHLPKIYSNLPKFIADEMKGTINNGRQELEQFVTHIATEEKITRLEMLAFSPNIIEIGDKINGKYSPKEKLSSATKDIFKASQLPTPGPNTPPVTTYYFYFDCEYTLELFGPNSIMSSWFDTSTQAEEAVRWIRKIRYPNKEKRWIFIPSYRRAQIALLDWSGDETVTEESTIRILVVRPSEFDEYVKYCGNKFPVIRLPQDEIGVGYARYWIQKIALRLKLQFIWMIDDSVECFYEYHPTVNPPLHCIIDGKQRRNYTDYRRRKFGLVFERIEDFVKEADDSDSPIAAMSPRRWNPLPQLTEPFVCKPPQCAVYLNLRALSEKNVYYRPELKTLEDMIFGYECEKKGLKVFMDNRVHLQDHRWKNTGGSSPSVKYKPNKKAATTPAAES